jgi:nicotinamide riboside kinase
MASEDEASRRANRLLVCDTDLYVTRLYAEEFFGRCPAWIREAASERPADLHLLLDVDTPWAADPQRDRPHRRAELFARLRGALEADGRRHVVVSGSWEQRWSRARDAAAALLAGATRVGQGQSGGL